MIKLESYLEKPYVKFILWFLTGLFIILFGALNVKADTYNANQFTAQLYDNYGPTLSAVTTDFTNNRYQGIIPTMVANSSGAAWGISSPVGLIANHTYTMTVEITGTYGGRLTLSTFNRIGVGTTMQNAINSYQNNSYVDEVYSKVLDNGITIQFAFTPSINSSYIVFPFSTTYSGDLQYFYLTNIIIDDLGSEGVTQDEINNSLNNQTSVIQNSINNIENNINNTITNNFNDCITNVLNPSSYTILSYTRWNLTSYDEGTFKFNLKSIYTGSGGNFPIGWIVDLKPNTYYTFQANNAVNSTARLYWYIYTNDWSSNLYYYNEDAGLESFTFKTGSATRYYIQLYLTGSYSEGDTVTLSNLSLIEGQTGSSIYIPYGEPSCVNKIDQTNDKLDQTNDKLNDIDDTLNNSNIDDENVSSSFEDFNTFLDDNSTITRLITLPITLYTAILNNVNGTCSPFNLGDLYGVNLSLPCVNIGNYLGPALWGMIDIIISGFAVYYMSKKLVKIFNNVSSMKEGDVIDD